MPTQGKDRWDKADIVLKPLGGLLTAFVIAALGYFGTSYLDSQQQIEARTRLYAELMSKREEADSAIRKDMFNTIISKFITAETALPEDKVLALELLAYNFHDALDLSPLFKHVYRAIFNSSASGSLNRHEKERYLERLEKTAREVAQKQIAALEEAGVKLDGAIDFEELKDRPQGVEVFEGTLQKDGKLRKREFAVQALWADRQKKEIHLVLDIKTPRGDSGDADSLHSVFWVGFFDFPMVDNTRLSNGDRCAIVLRKLTQSSAEMTLVYFPGSRASLKDKPYYEEVMDFLLPIKGKT